MLRKPFNQFLEESHEAIGVPQLGHAFYALANGFGYHQLMVLDPEQFANSMRKALVFSIQGRSELAQFGDANKYASHPAIAAAAHIETPYLAEDIRIREGISPEAWAATFPPEVREGVILKLPVHRDGCCVLIIGCNGREVDTSAVVRATLHVAAHVFYDRLKALGAKTEQGVVLTNREAECLHWLSHGKTGAEIGRLTGISPRTVRYHLRNAKKKLGAGSVLDALVKLSANARRTR